MEKPNAYKPINATQWAHVKQQPKLLRGLRKLKARNMLKAITLGTYSAGNHAIQYTQDTFIFYYRGTPIVQWDVLAAIPFVELNAGPFEASEATRNQRKECQKAIENFCTVYKLWA